MDFREYLLFIESANSFSQTEIVIGVLIYLIGMYFYALNKSRSLFYVCFFIGTILVGIGMATATNFLFTWDEQFHAVVAKSMLDNPFHPILLGEKYHYGYQFWTGNHVWLHKQPLFLWQIAMSYKVLGVNLFALRFPSVILHAATSLLVLSIAKRYLSRYLALLAATLFAFSDFQLGMVSGSIGQDHNDIAFGFYVVASFWAWMKYHESKNFKWVLWIGLLCGAAILCKWLVGLVVFSGWGIVLLASEVKSLKAWRDIFVSFLVAILVALPWQIYCYFNFKKEFLYEMNYNSLHLFKALEGHDGDYYFYLHGMYEIYGAGLMVPILIFTGLLIMSIFALVKRNYLYLFGSSIFLIVFLFFTFAATKIVTYISITAVFGYVLMLFPLNLLNNINWRKLKYFQHNRWKYFLPIILLFVTILFFQINRVNHRFNFDKIEEVNMANYKKKYALNIIRQDNNPSQIYFIKDNRNMFIYLALRFYSEANVFPYDEVHVYKDVGKVIDLDGIGEDLSN